jgi:AbrB family looped-hinge helix DNA binding protein
MEMAKVTSKGQITIPISIRRRLGINEGDKLLFIDRPEGVMMVNPDSLPGGGSADEVEKPAPVKKKAAPKPRPQVAAVDSVPEPPAEVQPVAEPPLEKPPPEQPPEEVVSRPVPPPVYEPEKPDVQIGGFNLNTLLDEIRSIGSNI